MKVKLSFLRAVKVLIVFLLVNLPIIIALAETTAYSPPNSYDGGFNWYYEDQAYSSDNSYANSSEDYRYVSYYGFSFSLPTDIIIDGIEVQIEGYTTSRQATIDLSWNNRVNYTDGDPTTTFIGSDTTLTFGGPTSTWGRTWTPSELTSPNFRVRITNDAGDGTIFIDYLQVRIYYHATKTASSTSVICTPNSITFGASTTCTAIVTRLAGTNTPTGTVSWTSDGSGNFPTSCTLSGSGGAATCSVTYTPSDVGDGSHLLTATYGGDTNFLDSNGNQTVTVNPASTATTLDCTPNPLNLSTTNYATCDVDVTSAAGTPLGTVNLTPFTGGSFSSSTSGTPTVTSCSLSAGSCTVYYFPGAGNYAIHELSASYVATNNFSTSTGNEDLIVSPTAVDLESFTTEKDSGGALIAWQTVSEHDMVGFNLYRRTPPGDFVKINSDLIPAQASGLHEGRSYSYLDSGITPGVLYEIKLEIINTNLQVGGTALTSYYDAPYRFAIPLVVR